MATKQVDTPTAPSSIQLADSGASKRNVAAAGRITTQNEADKVAKESSAMQVLEGIKFSVPYVIKVAAKPSDRSSIEEISNQVFAEMDSVFNPFNTTSEISAFNMVTAGQPFPVSPRMHGVLNLAGELHAATSGCFDPTVAALWARPGMTGAVGWNKIQLESTQVIKVHDDVTIDLCGIAKGWAVDQLIERIKEKGFPDVYVDWGGDVRACGKHPGGRTWRTGVVQPPPLTEVKEFPEKLLAGDVRYLATVDLTDMAVATSGDYVQSKASGEYHVYDPQEQQPMKISDANICSATIVSSSCAVADALATSALVMKDPLVARKFLEDYRKNHPDRVQGYYLYVRCNDRLIELNKRIRGTLEPEERRRMRTSLTIPSTVVVVGGGLAGMSAAVEAYRTGAHVTLIDKEPKVGGNSAKATSGINAWGTQTQREQSVPDSEAIFERDTYASGKGGTCNMGCVRLLSTKSSEAVQWLIDEFHVPLTVLSQLGGHAAKRTHRAPNKPDGSPVPIGWLITNALRQHIESLGDDAIKVMTGCTMTKILSKVGVGVHEGFTEVTGVEYKTLDGTVSSLQADAVVLATGGYGADHTDTSLLSKHRPDICGLPTTNGGFATGDGIKLGADIGARLVDMDKVQLHPTGLVDPKDPTTKTKYLGPEALRGSGGILLNHLGKRFVNELDLRSVVSQAIFQHCKQLPTPKDDGPVCAFCILNAGAVEKFGKYSLAFYKDKLGLFKDAVDLAAIADIVGVTEPVIRETFVEYMASVDRGRCLSTGKVVFPERITTQGPFVVAFVTPSIHYCMGGLEISAAGEVQQETQSKSVFGKRRPILGLFAAGECTGGVHGNNRLGGNSLLECVVFGRVAGERAAMINQRDQSALNDEDWRPLVIREYRDTASKFGTSTGVIRFNLPGQRQMSGLSVGQYVAIRFEVDGELRGSFYSPSNRPNDFGVIALLIRSDVGSLKDELLALRPGDIVEFRAHGGLELEVKPERITYKGRPVAQIGMLAGGTGVAPMLQIIRAVFHSKPTQMRIIYAADRLSEFTYMQALDDLVAARPHTLSSYMVVNKPPQGWTQGLGFISKDIVNAKMFPPSQDLLIVVCGPPRMQAAMTSILDGMGYSKDMYYVFD